MQAELIAVGTELLHGRLLNANTAFLSRRLAALGIATRRHLIVGDDPDLLIEAIRSGVAAAEIVITTGGLGPTHDDITRPALLRWLGAATRLHRRIATDIRRRYRMRGLAMPPGDRCMAEVPVGAVVFPNRVGAAPGFAIATGDRWIIALPGPPGELQPMVERNLVPFLRRLRPAPSVIVSRTIKTTGLPESHVYRRVARWLRAAPPLQVGIYAGGGEVHLVITAQAPTRAAALRRIRPLEQAVRRRLAPWLFGTDDEILEAIVGRRLAQRRLSIAVAESCTGGLITHRLTSVPGSSRYLRESVVAYHNAAKVRRLLVPQPLLARHGAVSAPVAAAMARGIRRTAGSSLGLAVTGIAGPSGGTAAKPVGLVFLALSHARRVVTRRYRFLGDRATVMWRAAQAALDLVRRWLR